MSGLLSVQILSLFLVFSRVGGAIMLLPGFGEDSVTPRLRLLIAFGVTITLLPVVSMTMPALPRTLAGATAALGHELFIGLVIGTVSRLMFSALQVSGGLIAQQTGLAVAVTFDPTQGGQTVVVSRFMVLLAVVLVFATNTHHLLLAGIARSYGVFPMGGALPAGDFAALATRLVSESFVIGVQMAAPFLVLGVVFNLAVGLLARMAPAIPVFFIAQPLNLVLGLGLFSAVIGTTMLMFMDRYRAVMTSILGG